ncbi:MAG: thioredoxin domain-containing protein [Flavobacteriales bacterium]|nr:MAG: thioredoxin domain-containing protein [Flavobacteriales bacterium]
MKPKFTNALIHETSPYLLQHAHNPVHWEGWHPEVLAKAKKEKKLLLISIGYAACHWCHVMEHECFEDAEVAKAMNSNFINIKIDREERPDVDHIYMDALQIMTGSGGWPLNIVALPDGRPFWGATYVPKDKWIDVLGQLSSLYQNDPKKILGYAQNMAEGIKAINLIENKTDIKVYGMPQLVETVQDWSNYFDDFLGRYKRAPKFMMPVNLNFLLHFGTVQNDSKILDYVHTTLKRMAWGGIFDPIGGGFSRYSVDVKWHVPHFEKMLYDNAQLVSLYANAYAATKNELYRETVERTVDFVKTELMDKNHGFYSALDADSINETGVLEEGAYYVWRQETLESLLGDAYPVFKDYYNINDYGLWEHGNYVLIRDATSAELAKKHGIGIEPLKRTIDMCLKILKKHRDQRERPRLDDKILTSWNGLMLKALVDAHRYLGHREYLDLALKNAEFLQKNMITQEGGLFHNHKNGKSNINGYLEDYASVIEGYTALYEVTFVEKWLKRAKLLADYCLEHHYDAESKLFYFTQKEDDFIIRRTLETADNVIPASNSIMAKNLFRLSHFYPLERYGALALQMLINVQDHFSTNAQSHANWLQLVLLVNLPFYEVAIVGPEYNDKASQMVKHYLPDTVFAAARKESQLALLADRFTEGKTPIYICEKGACQLPVEEVSVSLAQLHESKDFSF